MTELRLEISRGQPFKFGTNWAQFLMVLNNERIEIVEASYKRVLDIASGGGLFSLAARRMGATLQSLKYAPAIPCLHDGTKAAFF